MSLIGKQTRQYLVGGSLRRRGPFVAVGPLTVLRCPTEGCETTFELFELRWMPHMGMSADMTCSCSRCGVTSPLIAWFLPRWSEAVETAVDEVLG